MKTIPYIVSAPSGAGKTSLVKAVLRRDPNLALAVSYTTRPPRPGEIDGVHYHFVDSAEFDRLIAEGEFLENAEVFGNRYGTAEGALKAQLAEGRDVLLEIDWQGARQVRERFPQAISIFVLPPSLAELEARLRGRGKDSDAVIAGRMAAARAEMSHYHEYDYLIVNDVFMDAIVELACVIDAERKRLKRADRLEGLLEELTGP